MFTHTEKPEDFCAECRTGAPENRKFCLFFHGHLPMFHECLAELQIMRCIFQQRDGIRISSRMQKFGKGRRKGLLGGPFISDEEPK